MLLVILPPRPRVLSAFSKKTSLILNTGVFFYQRDDFKDLLATVIEPSKVCIFPIQAQELFSI